MFETYIKIVFSEIIRLTKAKGGGILEKATLGQQLKKYRKQRNLTQTQVAMHLNIRRQTYSNYERDIRTPDPLTLSAIAVYFHTNVDTLLQTDCLKESSASEFYHEGIIPASNSHIMLTGTEARLVMDYRSLSESGQEQTLRFVRFMKTEDHH